MLGRGDTSETVIAHVKELCELDYKLFPVRSIFVDYLNFLMAAMRMAFHVLVLHGVALLHLFGHVEGGF